MDFDTELYFARLNAQEILLQELWALFMKLAPDPVALSQAIREKIISSLNSGYDISRPIDNQTAGRFRDMTVIHIENFFDVVDTQFN